MYLCLFFFFLMDIVLVHLGCYHKIPQTGSLETIETYFSQLRRLEVQDQISNMVLFWQRPTSWFRASTFSLYPYMLERERDFCRVSFLRTLVPFMRAPPPHDLKISQRPHLPIPSSVGIRTSTYEFGGNTNIQIIADTK